MHEDEMLFLKTFMTSRYGLIGNKLDCGIIRSENNWISDFRSRLEDKELNGRLVVDTTDLSIFP